MKMYPDLQDTIFDRFSGDNSERDPPDPISNSEVKPFSADDSVGFPCESRTSPDLNIRKALRSKSVGLFLFEFSDALFGCSCAPSEGYVRGRVSNSVVVGNRFKRNVDNWIKIRR